MKIVDIGCGRAKLPGSIGIDISPYSDADIVVNLNSDPFPFEDNSVDFVYSSHALEHLTWEGFLHAIAEIYRICKPEGSIFITVPYFQALGNLANPFHNNNIAFNEHTFRFFSSEPTTPALPPEEYYAPTCPQWGLRYSAVSEIEIELRTLKIDYTYFEAYEELSPAEQARGRQQAMNVVDCIHYWLKPIKPAPRLLDEPSQASDPHGLVADKIAYAVMQNGFLNNWRDRVLAPDAFGARLDLAGHATVADLMAARPMPCFERLETIYADPDGLFYPPDQAVRILDRWIQGSRFVLDVLLAEDAALAEAQQAAAEAAAEAGEEVAS